MVIVMKTDFDYYIDEFCHYLLIERTLSQKTIESYQLDIMQYTKYLRNTLNIKDINQIKKENINEFLSNLYDSNLKSNSISRKISSIKMFHRFLFLNHYTKENVSSFIVQPKLEKKIPNVLSIQEVDDLLNSFTENNAIELRNKTMVELLYSTGLRISELVNLNISDINLSMGYVKCHGKGNKERIIPVGEVAITLLQKYLRLSRNKLNIHYDNQVLFLSRNGLRITRQHFFKILKKHAAKINLKRNISPHKLRHSFATHLLANSVDIRYIQELLGHSDISTTQIYTHVNAKKLNEVVNHYHPRKKLNIKGDKK